MKNKNIITPRLPSGFMELSPQEQNAMTRMQRLIANTFESFGFTPLDTPVMELSEVLLAKAGEETEKLMYNLKKGTTQLSLRFDLTVPLSRYVVMHKNDIQFPFKRYQIGKVYRGERPQKGRFREFYQCDIDIVGQDELSVKYDSELPAVMYKVFTNLGVEDFTILLSNRKILNGIFDYLGIAAKTVEISRTIDKIMKIGVDNVILQLQEIGLTNPHIEQIIAFISQSGSSSEVIDYLEALTIDNNSFASGLLELKDVVNGLRKMGVPEDNFRIDLSITRGLDYYTGTVYETILNDYPEIGSICSGGRYDDLASFYTKEKLPGVGMSIGLSRLYDQFSSRGFIQPTPKTPSDILLLPMTENIDLSLRFATMLRESGVKTEVFMEVGKFRKKMDHANKIGVKFTGIIGEDEIKNQTVSIKNMETGKQDTLPLSDAAKFVLEYVKEFSITSKPIRMRKKSD